MTQAINVANYILTLTEPDIGDYISNLKLQKLLYYCQGFNLALTGAPLFEEEVVAWEHGPVVPNVYKHFKDYGSTAIPIPSDVREDSLTKEEREIIEEVYEVYGQFSAWKLRNLTHAEPPWNNTAYNGVISHALMKDYFKTLINNGQ